MDRFRCECGSIITSLAHDIASCAPYSPVKESSCVTLISSSLRNHPLKFFFEHSKKLEKIEAWCIIEQNSTRTTQYTHLFSEGRDEHTTRRAILAGNTDFMISVNGFPSRLRAIKREQLPKTSIALIFVIRFEDKSSILMVSL